MKEHKSVQMVIIWLRKKYYTWNHTKIMEKNQCEEIRRITYISVWTYRIPAIAKWVYELQKT